MNDLDEQHLRAWQDREFSRAMDSIAERSRMKWFVHSTYNGKRDYECTNVVYCNAPEAPGPEWRETMEPLHKLTTMIRLYRQGEAQFYGWL